MQGRGRNGDERYSVRVKKMRWCFLDASAGKVGILLCCVDLEKKIINVKWRGAGGLEGGKSVWDAPGRGLGIGGSSKRKSSNEQGKKRTRKAKPVVPNPHSLSPTVSRTGKSYTLYLFYSFSAKLHGEIYEQTKLTLGLFSFEKTEAFL